MSVDIAEIMCYTKYQKTLTRTAHRNETFFQRTAVTG